MKKIFLILIAAFAISKSFSQSVGIGTNNPDPSAALEINSTTKGFLIPHLIANARANIISPPAGLLVYDTDYDSFWYHNDTAWKKIEPKIKLLGWSTLGNNGTIPSAHFLGTINNQPLYFRLNNNWAGELNQLTRNVSVGYNAGKNKTIGSGNVAIGQNALDTNTVGYANIAIGNYTLPSCLKSQNVAIGYLSIYNNVNGSRNTAIGAYTAVASLSGGDNNTAIGEGAVIYGTLTNAVAIGASSYVACSNCLSFGSHVINAVFVGINNPIPAYSLDINQINNRGLALRHPSDNNGLNTWEIYHAPNPYSLPASSSDLILLYNNAAKGAFSNSGGAYSLISDVRLKKNIAALPLLTSKIKLLTAKSYYYINNNIDKKESFGFLAQDVEKIFPGLVQHINTEEKNEKYKEVLTINYNGFGVLSIKAIQEQEQLIQEQQAQIDELKKLIEKIKSKSPF